MDRMLAILGALLEDNDNDEDSRAFMKINFNVPGEYTDTELTRVGVYSTVSCFGFFATCNLSERDIDHEFDNCSAPLPDFRL